MNNKQNTVELSLADYLELYEFQKQVKENSMVVRDNPNSHYLYSFYTKDEALIEIGKMNENLSKQLFDYQRNQAELLKLNNRLSKENEKMKATQVGIYDYQPLAKFKNSTIEEIKKFSIWEFLKWRKVKSSSEKDD